MYDLIQLKTFVTVVQEGHLTRASERLHISQPTASHHIRALEEHFGLPLFRRTSRGLDVTPAGKQIAEWAGDLIQASHQLNLRAKQLAGVPTGRLAIGIINQPQLLASIATVMVEMRERYPMTEWSLEAGNSWSIRQAIKSGELDAGAVAGVVRGEALACLPLGMLDYVLVAPSAWREKLSTLNTAHIAALPWVVTGRHTPSQDLIERLFREEGLEINAALTVSNAALVRAMVAGGAGIGFVQRAQAEEGVNAGLFVALKPYQASLPLTFVHAKARSSDTVLAHFSAKLAQVWPTAKLAL